MNKLVIDCESNISSIQPMTIDEIERKNEIKIAFEEETIKNDKISRKNELIQLMLMDNALRDDVSWQAHKTEYDSIVVS